MIEVSNLRKYKTGGKVKLEADITFQDMASPYPEKTIYFEIDSKFSYMLADDSYDAFVLLPLLLAMLHKQTLHIRGKISKRLYQNVKWYIQKIWSDFASDLSPVKFIVDGLTKPPKTRGKIIGASISCGVDSLSTVYDHFVRESDPDYRINALFYFNCDIKNHLADSSEQETIFQKLSENARRASDELGLPLYLMENNFHVFNQTFNKIRNRWLSFVYVGAYSCILSLSNAISKYYFSSDRTYEELKNFPSHNKDMGSFCESYFVPLIGNERTELIIDGCQYRRVDKLKNIADWDIAKKYLNVCTGYNKRDGANCGVCSKCLRTLLPLEIMGKLDDYAEVFDIDEYKQNSLEYKIHCLQNYGKTPFDTENVDLAKENNFPMPEKHEAYLLNGHAVLV